MVLIVWLLTNVDFSKEGLPIIIAAAVGLVIYQLQKGSLIGQLQRSDTVKVQQNIYTAPGSAKHRRTTDRNLPFASVRTGETFKERYRTCVLPGSGLSDRFAG